MAVELEKYRGTKSRFTCPACNQQNSFTRYITDGGGYLSDDVGRCNRETKCGYEYKPKQFFADNPTAYIGLGERYAKPKKRSRANYGFTNKNGSQVTDKAAITTDKPDYIPFERFKPTLGNYDRNAFVQFLLNLFPDSSGEIQDVLKMYLIGTFDDYTCFPSIDRVNRVCRAKLIRFNPATGRRLKGKYDTSSLPAKLKLKKDFAYKQIFFGEHLLSKYQNKPIAIVEAEKTAIIASLCFPEFVWLGSNSKSWLKVERLKQLGKRQIILYPDADGFELWQEIALDGKRQGLTIKVTNLIENHATDEQKANGYDLADYLINQQKEISELNEVYDAYNSKVERILNDESLFDGFNLFLDEQKAIAIYNGSTEQEAERICTQPENLRNVVMSL
jgi:hypothetical protein